MPAIRTFDSATRLNLSAMGNPRFRVRFDDGSSAQTQTDAACGYEVDNFKRGDLVVVQFSRGGRIVQISKVDGDA